MTEEKTFQFQTPRIASQLYCGKVEYLKEVENQLGVELVARDAWIQVTGDQDAVEKADSFFQYLDKVRAQGMQIRQSDFSAVLNQVVNGKTKALKALVEEPLILKFFTAR